MIEGQAQRSRNIALRIERFLGVRRSVRLREYLLAVFFEHHQAVGHGVVILFRQFVPCDLETRPQHLARMIHRRIERSGIFLASQEAQIPRRQRVAWLDLKPAHLDLQLRHNFRPAHLILHLHRDPVGAAHRVGGNHEAMQKLRQPVLVLRKNGFFDAARRGEFQRHTRRIGNLNLPGELHASLLVSRGGHLISAEPATEKDGFPWYKDVGRRQHRPILELMQSHALNGDRGVARLHAQKHSGGGQHAPH